MTKKEIANNFNISKQTVHVVKQDFLSLSMEDFLQRKKQAAPPIPVKVDGNVEALIIALCCSNPPEGYSRWTVRLLADKCVKLGYVNSISHMTVSRKKCWCISPKQNAAFVAAMEDVLEVHNRPYSEDCPKIKQLDVTVY